MMAHTRIRSVLPLELIPACWYVHVSAPCIPLSLSISDALIAYALHSFAIHVSHPFIVHASHSFVACASHSPIIHVSARLHLFMRCILSLFSCISHSEWSLPDHSFFLLCIKSRTQPHVQKTTIHASHSFIIHTSHVSGTRHTPLPFSVLLSMYHIHGLMLPSLFPLLFMYQVEYLAPRWGDTSRRV